MENIINADPINVIVFSICLLILLIACAFIVPIIIKKAGIKKISKEGIELNSEQIKQIQYKTSNNIHEVQRKQLSFVDVYLKNVRHEVEFYIDQKGYRHEDYNIPFVIEILYDEIVSWIVFNNIENATEYISLHDEKLWLVYKEAVMQGNSYKTYNRVFYNGEYIDKSKAEIDWFSEYFENLCSKITKEVVVNLVRIKILQESFEN